MKISLSQTLIFLVVFPFTSAVVAADSVLDQYVPPSSTGQWIIVGTSSGDRELAQTFTVGVAGTLTRFEAYINSAGNYPVLWDIRPTVDGAPVESDAASLASGTFHSSEAPDWGFYGVGLGPSLIPVSAGDVLALVFRTPPGYSGVSIGWQGEKPDPYAGGAAFFRHPETEWAQEYLTGYDMRFRTYVQPVPEPSTAVLLVVGVFALLGASRRTLGRS